MRAPSREECIAVARQLWGQETLRHHHEMRWGEHGSRRLNLVDLVWSDYEAGTRGGWKTLYELAGMPLPRDDPPETAYSYCDAAGRLLFQVVRRPAHRFVQRRPDGQGSWIYNLSGVERVLYRLPQLLAAAADELIFITEGEKDADNVAALGLVATTNPGGAGKWSSDYNYCLTSSRVVLLPDNDPAGKAHMEQIARSLHPTAARVVLLELDGLGHKEDVSDWLARGGTADALYELAATAPPWTPDDAPPPPSPPRYGRIINGDELMGVHQTPDWLIEGIVQKGRLYACTSRTAHGKTAVWLYLGSMIHAGRMAGNLEITPGTVLYIAGENPSDLAARMLGMCQRFAIPSLQMPYVLPAAFPLDDDGAELLKSEIRSLDRPLSLIVGDTAASFFPGDDENDNVLAGNYARTLRSLTELPGNPAVVVLSHPVKNATRDNLLPRGGGAFLNELDSNLTLWSEALGETTILHWQGKIRGPDFNPLRFRLGKVGTGLRDKKDRPEITIVAEPMSEDAAVSFERQLTEYQDRVLHMLKIDPDRTQAQLAHAAGWLNPAGEPERWRVQYALDGLEQDGLIQQMRKRGPWTLTKKGTQAIEK